MFQRPQRSESDEDLMKQDEDFQLRNDVKVVRSTKRKSELPVCRDDGIVDDATLKPISRFAQKRQDKKRKNLIVDNTILEEAVSQQTKIPSVITSIVERNVPTVIPSIVARVAAHSPKGFPEVPKLGLLKLNTMAIGGEKKSLYMQQMEMNGVSCSEQLKQHRSAVKLQLGTDEKLIDLGNRSYVIGPHKSDAKKIHEENMSILSNLSHQDRIKERNEILSSLDENQVSFIKSLRARKVSATDEKMDTGESSGATNPEHIVTQSSKCEEICEPKSRVAENNDFEKIDKSVTQKIDSVSEESDMDLPIPLSNAQKWIHMDKVELDKLKWMKQVSKPKPLKNGEGFVARFNFDGYLLPYNDDISWREGLHHHGEEPDRPGYTLDELFIFVRSNFTQQRHFGLKTLANILRNAKDGIFDECFDYSIIQIMVDAGLVLLLRFAIDETTVLVYQEALRALYYLICSEPDDKCLDTVETWFPYDVYPGISSVIHAQEKARKELDSEEKELKDVEVIRLDIVRALVRMDILIRFRYFLESVTLSPPDVIHILGVLKRISRHSLDAASSVASTQRLLKVICDQFLPSNYGPLLGEFNVNQITSVYGIPLRHALQLFKVLAARSRHIASNLINNFNIMSRIQTYVSVEPSEGQLPLEEALQLSKDAYSLWGIFMSYGLKKAQEAYINFFPFIIKQLIFYRDKIDVNLNVEANRFNYDIGCHLMHVITKALNVAAHRTLLFNRMKRKESSITTARGEEQVLQPPLVDWQDFDQIFDLVQVCITKWVVQFTRLPESSFGAQKLLGTFFSFVASYLEKWRDQNTFEGAKFIIKIKEIFSSIDPLLQSNVIDSILSNLIDRSNLVCDLRMGTSRDPKNLGSLACICHGGKVVPVLQSNSPFPLLVHLTSLLKSLVCHHPSLDAVAVKCLLNNEKLKSYLNAVASSERHRLRGHWMNRIEIFCITNILKIASVKGCYDPVSLHKTALAILPYVHNGDECLIKTLLEDIICNSMFMNDLSDIESQIDILSIVDFKPLKSPTLQQPIISPLKLTVSTVNNIHSIGQDFTRNLMEYKTLEESIARANNVSFIINSLTVDRLDNSMVLDPYWSLAPLKLMKLVPSESSSSDRLLSVIRWLQMTFVLLKWRSNVSSRQCDPTGWLRHLSLVFLVSSDLFLDIEVNSYLQSCLSTVLQNENYLRLTCTNTYPGLSDCFDWFKELAEQFAAVSYRDSTFALFVIIPLQRRWPKAYREHIFGDNSDALQFIALTVEDVNRFIPIKAFLEPVEEDKSLLVKYRSMLGNRIITERRNPFLFHFASIHTNSFSVELKN